MTIFSKKIRQWQQQPYQKRLKIFKVILALVAILLLTVWGLTLKYRKTSGAESPSKFNEIINTFKNIGELKWQRTK